MNADDFFGEVIHSYTDSDAINDGVLIDISSCGVSFCELPINRITQPVMADFQQSGLDDSQIAPALRAKCEQATSEGGCWILPPNLWLIENEVGGWTLMYPSDY